MPRRTTQKAPEDSGEGSTLHHEGVVQEEELIHTVEVDRPSRECESIGGYNTVSGWRTTPMDTQRGRREESLRYVQPRGGTAKVTTNNESGEGDVKMQVNCSASHWREQSSLWSSH